VLSAANPRITITMHKTSTYGPTTFDWTSDQPIVAVIIKASTTGNIWYYTRRRSRGPASDSSASMR
jgi:hypothetical protein